MTETEFPHGRAGRVVVGVTGSPSSQAALRRAVQEARRSGRTLVPVLAWEPPGGEAVYRLAPEPHLAARWEREARQRLAGALADVLGEPPAIAARGMPADAYGAVPVEPAVVRAPAAYALAALADQSGDLLVLGAGPRGRAARLLRGRVRRRAAARAQSPVLLVGAPELPRAVRRELRRVTPEDILRGAGTGFAC